MSSRAFCPYCHAEVGTRDHFDVIYKEYCDVCGKEVRHRNYIVLETRVLLDGISQQEHILICSTCSKKHVSLLGVNERIRKNIFDHVQKDDEQ
jgi:hypothetical protein